MANQLRLSLANSILISLCCLFVITCTDNPLTVKTEYRDPADFEPKNVLINEFMVSQEATLADPDFNEFGSWIELINKEDSEVDISEWIVSSSRNEFQYTLPEGTVIPPNSFLLLWANARNAVMDGIHTNFQLSPGGGFIGLFGPEWSEYKVIDSLSYVKQDVRNDISWGRIHFDDQNHSGFLLPLSNPTPGEPNTLAYLELLDQFNLNISDPSGLAPDHTGHYFWTVSDDPGGSIYKITRTGVIVDELKVQGDDMEGITQNFDDLTLWVAEERKREIVQFDTLGRELQRVKVQVDEQRLNDGLEGITINPNNGHIYVANEKNPRKLLEIDLSRPEGERQVNQFPVNFSGDDSHGGLDLSGLFFDPEDDTLWMVSDEAASIFQLDLKGRPLAVYYIGKKDLEGIAVLSSEGKIYLVSDELHTLFVYKYPEAHQ